MRYFVTGATGFIGGRLSKRLVESGHQVVALVRSPRKGGHLEKMGVLVTQGDITDKESLRIPMSGVDGIFHVAGWYKVGVRDKSSAEKINVDGTRNVLEVMNELGIKKGVYTSSLAVFSDTKGRRVDESYRYEGTHLSEYDRTKWLAHYRVAQPMMDQGLPLVIVLPGVVYGPGDTSSLGRSLKKYLRGKLPLLPTETAFCWTHVDDVVQGHILAMEKGQPGESYSLAGPPHTLEEAFRMAERITAVKAPGIRLSPGVLRFLSKIMAAVEPFVPLPEDYSSEGLRVVAGVTYLATNEKAKRELGYTLRPLEAGLRETLATMTAELNSSRAD
ncbi:MAG: NAD-dependent epimerase/dehydratase family protein [Fidelibacterota bacterium]